MSLEEDGKLLRSFMLKEKHEDPEANFITDFKCYGPVYPYTNELITKYPISTLEGKKVLSVTSSGDHILFSVLKGATDITGFDINRFCKYYSALKIAMIKHYDYNKFMKKIDKLTSNKCYLYHSRDRQYNEFKEIFEDNSPFLTEDEILFFEYFLKLYKSIDYEMYLDFFELCPYLKTNISYFDKDNFKMIKRNLNECDIKYIDCGIDKLNNGLTDRYDVIFSSNILDRMTRIVGKNANKLLTKLSKLLVSGGVLYDYSFLSNIKHTEEHKKYDIRTIEVREHTYDTIDTVNFVSSFTKK